MFQLTEEQAQQFPLLAKWPSREKLTNTCPSHPQQFELLFENGTGIYIRIRAGFLEANFCPDGELKRGDPLIYSEDRDPDSENNFANDLQGNDLFQFIETLIPIIEIACEKHVNGIEIVPVEDLRNKYH